MDLKSIATLSAGCILGVGAYYAYNQCCREECAVVNDTKPVVVTPKYSLTLDLSQPDRDNFLKVFDWLLKDMQEKEDFCHNSEVVAWLDEMQKYNVPHGKLTRGLAVVAVSKCLDPEGMKDNNAYISACILGWCIEWLQAFFLVADDIMDHSITRRGQPCWYKIPKVGMIAVNDCCILEAFIYRILRKYLHHLPCYHELVELFHDVSYATSVGQLLDLLTAPEDKDNFHNYNMTRFCEIVKMKTAHYTIYLPTACGLHLCGVTSPATFASAKSICLKIGEYFQVQDDFLDCYGEPAVIGKIGTDIEDNKCSWLVCQAAKLCNTKQLATLKKNYGKNDPKAVKQVKNIYNELKLKELFEDYEQKSHDSILAMVTNEVPANLQPIYHWYLNKLFKRNK